MSKIESLCQKAIVAAQNNDFTTVKQNYDAAIEHFAQAQKIARSHKEIRMRDRYALDAEMLLADLFLSKGTDEYIVLSQH